MDSERSRYAERAAGAALAITFLLATAKVIVWAMTGSLAVLSQALDSVVDIVALGLVYIAVRIAGKPADAGHHYGHAKAENLAAFTQTLLLGAIVVAIAIEAAGRLAGAPTDVDAPPFALALMVISLAIDALRARYLARAGRATGSEALRSGALNLVGDVGTAVVALISLVLVGMGVANADAVGALLVGAGVLLAGLRLGKRSVDVLMDKAPEMRVEAIEAATTSAAGVAETRRVRVRDSGKQLFADVTVAAGRTASLERAHDIAESVEREIEAVVPGADVVVHVEPLTRSGGFVEQVQAAASKTEGVHEVHDVAVHNLDERDGGRLHVTLHAKVMPGVSLEEAHDLSDAIETSVVRELGRDVRVDTHIEPLEGPAPGHDVTVERPELVASIKELAEREHEVIDCHEVLITAAAGELTVVAHVTGRSDLPLARMHDASVRIEGSVHDAHREVGPVLIHFEPA
ncbi:MAG: cation diffusion facilitator family transporter [Actinomycetota bacterium]